MSNFASKTIVFASTPSDPDRQWVTVSSAERKPWVKVHVRLKGDPALAGVVELSVQGCDQPYVVTVDDDSTVRDFRIVSLPVPESGLNFILNKTSGSLPSGQVEAEIYIECDDAHVYEKDMGGHVILPHLLDK